MQIFKYPINSQFIVINMKEIVTTEDKILKECLKDMNQHSVSSLAKALGITRPGVWKALKKLEERNLVELSPINGGKTSTFIVKLNWNSILLNKILNLALTKDAISQSKWMEDFSDLEDKVKFLVLYGSILHSPKQANDIDVLTVVLDKNSFGKIGESVRKIQISQEKKIHIINLTEAELKSELKNNRAYIDALKKGVVLFGQDEFIKFVRRFRNE